MAGAQGRATSITPLPRSSPLYDTFLMTYRSSYQLPPLQSCSIYPWYPPGDQPLTRGPLGAPEIKAKGFWYGVGRDKIGEGSSYVYCNNLSKG